METLALVTYHRSKRDGNHAGIVQALRAAGCSVADCSAVGAGFPDLVVATPRGRTLLVEVKDPKGRNRVEASQAEFRKAWKGEIVVVRSPQEAIDACFKDLSSVRSAVSGQAESRR